MTRRVSHFCCCLHYILLAVSDQADKLRARRALPMRPGKCSFEISFQKPFNLRHRFILTDVPSERGLMFAWNIFGDLVCIFFLLSLLLLDCFRILFGFFPIHVQWQVNVHRLTELPRCRFNERGGVAGTSWAEHDGRHRPFITHSKEYQHIHTYLYTYMHIAWWYEIYEWMAN